MQLMDPIEFWSTCPHIAGLVVDMVVELEEYRDTAHVVAGEKNEKLNTSHNMTKKNKKLYQPHFADADKRLKIGKKL